MRRIRNLRLRMEGVLWRLRTGCPWRDLPSEFGSWSTVFNFFHRWSKRGLWKRVFECVSREQDNEWNFLDGSHIKVHQHGMGAAHSTPEQEGIGKTRGGNTSKIHARCDGHGNPAQFILAPGNRNEFTQAEALLKNCRAEFVIADKGYDSIAICELIIKNAGTPIIPSRFWNRKQNKLFDKHLYRHRHLIENLFARLKHFRAIATRYDKRGQNYFSFVCIAATMIWINL